MYCHNWLHPENRDCYFFDMEYCEKNLDNHIKDLPTALDERIIEVIQISNDIIDGLVFIHALDEVHRDLKPSNGTTHCPRPFSNGYLCL
jgi:serine/threonine protein kinase